jgi:DNA-binding transcriptional ArsR family regulator
MSVDIVGAPTGIAMRKAMGYALNHLVNNLVVKYMPSDHLSSTLFALSDPTRRGILARLATGDATVTELAEPYDMSLAAVSKHLKVLETAGLISRGREAQWRPCHLEAAPLRDVFEWLESYQRFWNRSLDSLAEYLAVMKNQGRKNKDD